ncbi:hypothetical protein BdWA1_001352 [Babesia duncani]|uniref:Uncharacterized protein n=1 Tax=Babesia duncani TaxID=323732 RepID=A0AAD9PHS7_9APIC|nr:hypothetical protein BdWA1_003730 [Babesia duncani]KAK2198341.1 hypothetical protein BdWA1_001352 [Babesia duncani]
MFDMMTSYKFPRLCITALLFALCTISNAHASKGLYPPSWFKITKIEKNAKNFNVTFEIYISRKSYSLDSSKNEEFALLVQPPSSLKYIKEINEFKTTSLFYQDKHPDVNYFNDPVDLKSEKDGCKFTSWTKALFEKLEKDEDKLKFGIFHHDNKELVKLKDAVTKLTDTKYTNIISASKTIYAAVYTWTGEYSPTTVANSSHFEGRSHDWVVAIAVKGNDKTISTSVYKGCVGIDPISSKAFLDQANTDKYSIIECGGLYEYDVDEKDFELIYHTGSSLVGEFTAGKVKPFKGSLKVTFKTGKINVNKLKDASHTRFDLTFGDLEVHDVPIKKFLTKKGSCKSITLTNNHVNIDHECDYNPETGSLILIMKNTLVESDKEYVLTIDTSSFEALLPKSIKLNLEISYVKDMKSPEPIKYDENSFKLEDATTTEIGETCINKIIDLYKDSSERMQLSRGSVPFGKKTAIINNIDTKHTLDVLGLLSKIKSTHIIQLYVQRDEAIEDKTITVELNLENADGKFVIPDVESDPRLYGHPTQFSYPGNYGITNKGKTFQIFLKTKKSLESGYYLIPVVFDYDGESVDFTTPGVLGFKMISDKKDIPVESFFIFNSVMYPVVTEPLMFPYKTEYAKIEFPYVWSSRKYDRMFVDIWTLVTKKVSIVLKFDTEVFKDDECKGLLESKKLENVLPKCSNKNTVEFIIDAVAGRDYFDKFSLQLDFNPELRNKYKPAVMEIVINTEELNTALINDGDEVGPITKFKFDRLKEKTELYRITFKMSRILGKTPNELRPCIGSYSKYVNVPFEDNTTAAYFLTRVFNCTKPWLSPAISDLSGHFTVVSYKSNKEPLFDRKAVENIGLGNNGKGISSVTRELMKQGRGVYNSLYVLFDNLAINVLKLEFKNANYCSKGDSETCGYEEVHDLIHFFVEKYLENNDAIIFNDIIIAIYNKESEFIDAYRKELFPKPGLSSTYIEVTGVKSLKLALDYLLDDGYNRLRSDESVGTFSVFVAADEKHTKEIKTASSTYTFRKDFPSDNNGQLLHPIWVEVLPIKHGIDTSKIEEHVHVIGLPILNILKDQITTSNPLDILKVFFVDPFMNVNAEYKYDLVENLNVDPEDNLIDLKWFQRRWFDVYVNFQDLYTHPFGTDKDDTPTGLLKRFKIAVSNGIRATLSTFHIFATCMDDSDMREKAKTHVLSVRGYPMNPITHWGLTILERPPRIDIDDDETANTCDISSLYENVPGHLLSAEN